MIMMCLGSLVKGQSRDTIVITKTHYKTLLEIAAEEHACQLTLASEESKSKVYLSTIHELNQNVILLDTTASQCAKELKDSKLEIIELNNKVGRKNKKLGVSYGLIGIWAVYQGVKIYLILKPV